MNLEFVGIYYPLMLQLKRQAPAQKHVLSFLTKNPRETENKIELEYSQKSRHALKNFPSNLQLVTGAVVFGRTTTFLRKEREPSDVCVHDR